MNEFQIIGLITVIGSLILVWSEFRSTRGSPRKTIVTLLIWIGLFAAAALAFGSMQ